MIKDFQISSIKDYQDKLRNDISMLSWKVYSTKKLSDDQYFDDFDTNAGIDYNRSVGQYVPPTGGNGGYFKYLQSSSGIADYNFTSSSKIVRNPLHQSISQSIDTWVSDSSSGTFYTPIYQLYTWAPGRVTIRNRLRSLIFTVPCNAIRFKFSASNSVVKIDNASFGVWKSGTEVGIVGTPASLTFNQGVSWVNINPNESVWSDWLSFDVAYNVDHVLVLDLSDGNIQYAATSNLGLCLYQPFGSSYYIATPNEINFIGGSPWYNTYIIPVEIQYASGSGMGHFISDNSIAPIGSGTSFPEVESGCSVELESGSSATLLQINGNGTASRSVILDSNLESGNLAGIYGSKYSSGSVIVNSSSGISPSNFVITKGDSSLRINTRNPSYWSYIQAVIYKSNPGNSLIYHFVSFDSQSSWIVFKNGAWRTVARQSTDGWQYNTSSNSTPVWGNTDSDRDLTALKLACNYSLNCMTTEELTGLTESQWSSYGGLIFGQTLTMDLAFAMKSSGSNIPSVSRYVINYSINTSNVFFISQFWRSSKINPKIAYSVFYVSSSELFTLNSDVQAWISTNDGYDYDQLTLSNLRSSGSDYYLEGVNNSLTQRDNQVIRVKFLTFNQKDIRLKAYSVSLRYS